MKCTSNPMTAGWSCSPAPLSTGQFLPDRGIGIQLVTPGGKRIDPITSTQSTGLPSNLCLVFYDYAYYPVVQGLAPNQSFWLSITFGHAPFCVWFGPFRADTSGSWSGCLLDLSQYPEYNATVNQPLGVSVWGIGGPPLISTSPVGVSNQQPYAEAWFSVYPLPRSSVPCLTPDQICANDPSGLCTSLWQSIGSPSRSTCLVPEDPCLWPVI
jgi:hypothetical protein